MTHELETRWPTPEEAPYLNTQILTEKELTGRINLIGAEIYRDLKNLNPLVVSVHEGGKYFIDSLSELWKSNFDFQPETTSMKAKRTSDDSGFRPLEIIRPLPDDIEVKDRVILITEDMMDEGDTLAGLVKYFYDRGGLRVYVAVMTVREGVERDLDCPEPRYIGFYLHGDGWAVGSGLDDNRMRLKGVETLPGGLPNDGGRDWPGIWINHPPDHN